MTKKEKQKGVAAVLITILVLSVMFAVAMSFGIITVAQERASGNVVKASQAYYAAETGMEDALLRLKNNPAIGSLSYTINVGGETVDVVIPNVVGGSRTITSEGDVKDRVKKVQAVYTLDSTGVGFSYGAQVGEGGLEMGNNSRVAGNVFSNGNVIGGSGATVDNTVIIANNGNRIEGLDVGENVLVHSCKDSDIGGDLIYVSGGSVTNCNIGGSTIIQADEIEPVALPISQSQINDWETEAADGGVIANDVSYLAAGTNYLGPAQIGTSLSPKNLVVTNNARLKIKGTVYVTGDITFSNNAIIELDASYGSFSGVIIADGKINTGNNAVLQGSGQAGSYITLLSTSNSVDPASPAIMVSNNAQGAIFYASAGMVYLSNNMVAREITGYKMRIDNNAVIQYESGLQNILFTGGPTGSWEVDNWKETQ